MGGLAVRVLSESAGLLLIDGSEHPENAAQWLSQFRTELEPILLKWGAVLLRNFRSDLDTFSRIAPVLSPLEQPYTGGNTTREQVQDGVYTASSLPSSLSIPQHHEMMISTSWPMKLGFYCETPPEQGGETPLLSSRWFMEHVPRGLVDGFDARGGVTYVRRFSPDMPLRSLEDTFGTNDKSELEAICDRVRIELEWHGQERVTLRQTRPAFQRHPKSFVRAFVATPHIWHPSCWRRQLEQALGEPPREQYMEIEYADGTPVEPSVAEELSQFYETSKQSIPWQVGDVLVVENLLVSHGRNPYTGHRRILACLREPYHTMNGYLDAVESNV